MILYTAEWCSGCKTIKRILTTVGIDVEIIDIDERELTFEETTSIRSLPTLKRNGVYISGVEKIKEALRNM